MMRGFWTLPALLRIAVASQHVFSVNDDVLAFPQYDIKFSHDHLSETEAQSQLSRDKAFKRDTNSHDSDLSIHRSERGDEHHSSANDSDDKYYHEILLLKDEKYLCRIPVVVESHDADANDTLTKYEEEQELIRANERGWELLSEMQGNCIYFWSGWWSYSYCFGQGVKQFHQLPARPGLPAHPPIEDPNVGGYVLGLIEGSASGEKKEQDDDQEGTAVAAHKPIGHLETKGGNRYLVQYLSGGTECDLTREDRKIEVQFHCNPASHDRISLIKETQTCAYLMVIHTPRLCNDVAFLPPQHDHPNTITCAPILSPEEVPAYESRVTESSQQGLATHIPNPFENADEQPKPTVGHMTVGAHKYIKKGREIEKSAILGGGKETLIDTIADSTGKSLSHEALAKLGFKDSGSVERYKKKLQEFAGEKPWRLDIVDTPRGIEIKGVVIDKEDPKDAANAKGGEPEKKTQQVEDKESEHSEEENGAEEEQGSEETYKDEL